MTRARWKRSRALEAIQEADRRGGELASLALEFEWIARLNATSRALRDYLQSVLADGEALRQGPESHLRRMLDLVLAEKHVLFGVGDEQWNFAVYLHDPVGDVLTCRVCRRPLREEEEAAHRDWKPGEGHVGMAWQRGEELIASDSTDPQVEPFFRAPGAKFRNDDARRYRSIASVPIAMAGARPLGVLVATSDRMGRFVPKAVGSIDHVEPLRLLSSALAMMLHLAQLYEGKESGV